MVVICCCPWQTVVFVVSVVVAVVFVVGGGGARGAAAAGDLQKEPLRCQNRVKVAWPASRACMQIELTRFTRNPNPR